MKKLLLQGRRGSCPLLFVCTYFAHQRTDPPPAKDKYCEIFGSGRILSLLNISQYIIFLENIVNWGLAHHQKTNIVRYLETIEYIVFFSRLVYSLQKQKSKYCEEFHNAWNQGNRLWILCLKKYKYCCQMMEIFWKHNNVYLIVLLQVGIELKIETIFCLRSEILKSTQCCFQCWLWTSDFLLHRCCIKYQNFASICEVKVKG